LTEVPELASSQKQPLIAAVFFVYVTGERGLAQFFGNLTENPPLKEAPKIRTCPLRIAGNWIIFVNVYVFSLCQTVAGRESAILARL
jgi:hypothetical protein